MAVEGETYQHGKHEGQEEDRPLRLRIELEVGVSPLPFTLDSDAGDQVGDAERHPQQETADRLAALLGVIRILLRFCLRVHLGQCGQGRGRARVLILGERVLALRVRVLNLGERLPGEMELPAGHLLLPWDAFFVSACFVVLYRQPGTQANLLLACAFAIDAWNSLCRNFL